MIDPTHVIGSPTVSQESTEDRERTALDRDAFLRLLVEQLENQDPLDPMDSREMITQLSELSSVEYLMGMEQKLGSLEVSSIGKSNADAALLIGKSVTVEGSRLSLGTFDSAGAGFSLGAPAQDVTVTIRDSAGQLVNSRSLGPRQAGSHGFLWDGNDSTGARVEPGDYRMTVTAVDDLQRPVVTTTEVQGVVESVSYENGYPELRIGQTRARLGDVRAVRGAEANEGAKE